tara:strand:+ start:883 stop:1284 length:402 start_codon:yes stop_codon:yes gene_type:complete
MKTIILDTNFLLIPAQFKVDIFEEMKRIMTTPYKLRIMAKTIDELNNIINNKSERKQTAKDKTAAKIALQLIVKYKIVKILSSKDLNVDNLILNTATKTSHIVATQDINLKRKLKEKRIPLIILRKKQYLELQ